MRGKGVGSRAVGKKRTGFAVLAEFRFAGEQTQPFDRSTADKPLLSAFESDFSLTVQDLQNINEECKNHGSQMVLAEFKQSVMALGITNLVLGIEK